MQNRWYLQLLPLLLVVAIAFAGCTGDDGEQHIGDGDKNLDFTEFNLTVEAYLVENELEGATAIVVHRDYGVVHERAFGTFDIDRVSLLASASKIITAGVLMRLADDGLLDIDAPLSTYMPWWWGERPMDVTVAQLLSNSSGMVGLLDDPIYGPYLCQSFPFAALSSCARRIYNANDSGDIVPPDTEFRYGSGQWQLAGGIAETVSGRSWAELINETYVEPCGLDVLGYTNQALGVAIEVFLTGGDLEDMFKYPGFLDGDLADFPYASNPNMEGGGYTTVSDYGKILLMHLRGGSCANGRVLSRAAVERMQEDRIAEAYEGSTGESAMPGYGLGWWISRDEPGVMADPGAYGAIPWIDQERGYGVMIILEAELVHGTSMMQNVKPVVDRIFNAAE